MRSLIQLFETQKIKDRFYCLVAKNKKSGFLQLEIQSHLPWYDSDPLSVAYSKLLETEIPKVKMDYDLLLRIPIMSQSIATETRRGYGNIIIASRKVIDYLKQQNMDVSRFVESDLPNQNLLIIGYRSNSSDAGIILGTEDNCRLNSLLVQSNYHLFYKVLEIV